MKPLAALLLVLSLFDALRPVDQPARDLARTLRGTPLERPLRALSDAGRPVMVGPAVLMLALLDEAGGLTSVRACLVVLVPVNLVVEGLKSAVGRPRPDGDARRRNSSFPSSHAANAAALAWMLARRWPRARLPLWGLAALVALSRMVLDRHYLSDVVAGILIGIGCAALVVRTWPALDPARVRGRAVLPGAAPS